MKKHAASARRVIFFLVLWFVLSEGEALLVGAAAVPAASWLSLRLLPATRPIHLLPLLAMTPNFLWRSLLGGLDVGRRALDPRMPINPGWIRLPVDLPDGGRVALGGELSLMPGTLAAGTDRGRLLVHVLDKDQDHARMIRIEERRLGSVSG
ncbi:Na+/H+ antiporter subunit E [Loktanella sp. SALINAS62]|uniref:Na+/H+ antiporter subunit E n=1 Tax=Loktanella sp. SALINAS62 TaxID=2706124 RepID=UPI001B8BCDCC|nr:Na+/H+ antiporter subunit E [Loktanella sp. SALINAS62]MBS1304122.1 Na+/H+ antiporter subunit E [Loktanella sp. SALINAS62]